MSKPEFAHWLRQQVDERAPAAVVRFGDGEGKLLVADPADEESMKVAIRKLERESGLQVSAEAVIEVKALVSLAYDEADVIGIRFGEGFVDEHKVWMDRLAAIYAERRAAGRRPAALAHCLLNHDIAETLPEMLAGRRVSVISSRDLKPVLESEWGLADVAVYQVPSQHLVRDVDGAYEAVLHDIPIWPDVHHRLRSELAVRERGEVFLVGAGVFGKDLCIRIRDQGGIALDMGSSLDRIAGKITRGPRRRVLDLYAGGMSPGDIATDLERRYGAQVDAERISRGVDAVVDDPTWRRQPLEAVYPIVYFDVLQVEIGEGGSRRSRACCLAVGVTCEGERKPLGIWWTDSPDAEFWQAVFDDLRQRGLRDVPIACVDNSRGFAEALENTFPQAAVLPESSAGKYRSVASLPAELRGSVCADAVEAMRRQIRRALEVRGCLPDERAAATLIHLATVRVLAKSRRVRPS